MPDRNVCGRCGQPLKSHESISVANVGLRCSRCFNEETAAMTGRPFRQHAAAACLRFGRRWRRAHVRVPIDARAYRLMRCMRESACPKGTRGTSSPSSATSTPMCGTCSGWWTSAFSTDSPSAAWSEGSSAGGSRTNIISSGASPGIRTAPGRSRCRQPTGGPSLGTR